MWDQIEKYAYKFTYCPYCNAAPGLWCETSSGNEAQYLHGERTRPWQECWVDGYQKGENEVVEWYGRLKPQAQQAQPA